MKPPDPFDIFRTALFVCLTAYYVVITTMTAWRAVVLLRGSDPRERLLRVYVSYQLLSFRLKPLAGELAQIALCCAILLLLWHLHPN